MLLWHAAEARRGAASLQNLDFQRLTYLHTSVNTAIFHISRAFYQHMPQLAQYPYLPTYLPTYLPKQMRPERRTPPWKA